MPGRLPDFTSKRQQRIAKHKGVISTKKLYNSPYWSEVVDMVNNGMQPKEILNYLEKVKRFKISYPTLLENIAYIREHGAKAIMIAKESEAAITEVNEELKKLAPHMTNLFKRRTNLINEILNRKEKLLKKQEEGNRVSTLLLMLDDLKKAINNNEKQTQLKYLKNAEDFIQSNFSQEKNDPRVEQVIRQYIRDLHDIYSYVEGYTFKYDVYNIVDDLSVDIARSAAENFANYIKKDTPENRERILQRFKDAVKTIVDDIKINKLNIKEDTSIKEVNKQ